jgi:excisionase family DNA binding protein
VHSPYLIVQEVADLARCEHRTVRRAIKDGDLKASLIGGRWIVRDTAVEDWIEACANHRPTPAAARRRSRKRARPAGPVRPGSVADLEAIREKMVGS